MNVSNNKNKIKRNYFISFVILGVSILTAGYVVFNNSNDTGEFFKIVKGGIEDYRFAFSSGRQYKEILKGDNATERFIQNYGSQIALKNANGPEGETLTLPSQEIFNELLAKEVSAGIAYEPFNESEISIIPDSKINKERYISELRAVMEKQKTDLWYSIFEFSQNGDGRSLKNYISERNEITKNLEEMNVPVSWKKFHVDLVNFERRRVTAIVAIVNSENDPVKGLAAMEELPKLNELELELAKIFTEKSKEI